MKSPAYGWAVSAFLALGAGFVVEAQEALRIVPVVRQDRVVVSFSLADAYTDDVRDAIASGLRTTFTYDVQLRMVVPAWVDRTVATTVVSVTDRYDNLTRRHSLSRTVDGRIVDALVTEDEGVVRAWLSSVERLPLVETARLDANRDYYVRVSATARPSSGSFLGFTSLLTGQAKFTFIP
jgi:hypothetical protein